MCICNLNNHWLSAENWTRGLTSMALMVMQLSIMIVNVKRLCPNFNIKFTEE